MVKNTPEELQKVAENMLVELIKNYDCYGWDCDSCPFALKELEEDPRYGKHTCGWLLLKSATVKILWN